MIARPWIERGLIVVAALATIATGKPKWHLDATLPANDPATARLVVVAASDPPEIDSGAESITRRSLEVAQWPGEARYLIPAGANLRRVSIFGSGGCQGCGECRPPDTAFVRVVSITPVASWKLEAKSEEQTITLPPTTERYEQRHVAIRASHPTRSRVISSMHEPTVYDDATSVNVTWPHIDQEVRVTWTLHTTIEGPCPDLQPCDPPATAHISIGEVTRGRY